MSKYKGNKKNNYKIKAGKNAQVVGGNYTNTTNISLWISLIIVGVLGVGTLVLLGIRVFGNSIELKLDHNQQQPSPASTSTKNM
ncbi:MAG: hypothetical protein F6K31_24645 [Symploca sp. SIO2G7]|nr:hypothetical protein [Symploca sp. SIO2G7]